MGLVGKQAVPLWWQQWQMDDKAAFVCINIRRGMNTLDYVKRMRNFPQHKVRIRTRKLQLMCAQMLNMSLCMCVHIWVLVYVCDVCWHVFSKLLTFSTLMEYKVSHSRTHSHTHIYIYKHAAKQNIHATTYKYIPFMYAWVAQVFATFTCPLLLLLLLLLLF